MSKTILPYRHLGEVLGVHLDLGQIPHMRGAQSVVVDPARAGAKLEIAVEVQTPSSIGKVFPPSEQKAPPLEIVATVTSIDGGIRQHIELKRRKASLYTGKITLDLTRISESARIRVFAVRTRDGGGAGYARKKGSRLAWGPEIEIRLGDRAATGSFVQTVWEDFGSSVHVPRHFDGALYYVDAAAEPPVLYLNRTASAPLIKLMETEGHGHPNALPRDLVFRSIANGVWLTLAQRTLEELHEEAIKNGSPVDIAGMFDGSWKKEMLSILAPSLYPNLLPGEAVLQLGTKIEDKGFYAEALLRAQLAAQVDLAIREHFERMAERLSRKWLKPYTGSKAHYPPANSAMCCGAGSIPPCKQPAKGQILILWKRHSTGSHPGPASENPTTMWSCELLHSQLKHIPGTLKVDMRFWQWLAIKRFADLVWTRRGSGVPSDINVAPARSGMAHTIPWGNRSLRGRNRNTLSRLFFTAEILHDRADGYKLAAAAFANQDRHTSIFEREMGLVPAVAKALVRATKGMGSEEIQRTAKRLNHIGSALVLETVEERELISLLT